MKFLYRGVSENLYKKLDGKLMPKNNTEFMSDACAGDGHVVCGSGIECGISELNSVILHQWAQAGIPTSGISTTSSIDRAHYYALHDGKKNKGYIYKLSIEELIKEKVAIYKVNDLVPYPSVIEDDEHILVATDFGNISEKVIVSIEVVTKKLLKTIKVSALLLCVDKVSKTTN